MAVERYREKEGFIPDTPSPTSNVIKKGFICIPSSLYLVILLSGCHGNGHCYENLNFNSCCIFSSCLRVQSVIIIR